MSDLRATMKALASQTWRRMGQAHAAGLSWQEETNTEHLLLSLVQQHPDQVIVQAITRRDEAALGADWEWWFGGPGAWFGMRVQAKRVKLPEGRFASLRYRPRRGQPRQIDTLIGRAFDHGLTPAYCLYVFSETWPRLGFWPMPYVEEGENTPLGCLMAHASAVRQQKSIALPKVAEVSFPWHLLAPQPHIGAGAQAVLGLMRQSCGASGAAAVLMAGDNPDWPLFPPVAELPDHVRVLERRALGQIGGADTDCIYETAVARGLAGVALFATEPLARTQ